MGNKSLWFKFNRIKIMKFINYIMLNIWYYSKNGKEIITKDVIMEAVHEQLIESDKGDKFIKKHNLKSKEYRVLNVDNAFK